MADFDLLGDGLRKVLLAGIGALATGYEKSSELVDELVKKGEITVEQGKALNTELKRQRFVGYARSRLGNGLLERVRRVDGPVRRRLTFGFRRRQNRVDPAGKRGRP